MYKASVPDLATPGDTGGVALHKSLDLHQILAIGPTDLHLCHYRNNHIFIIITLQPGQCFLLFLENWVPGHRYGAICLEEWSTWVLLRYMGGHEHRPTNLHLHSHQPWKTIVENKIIIRIYFYFLVDNDN